MERVKLGVLVGAALFALTGSTLTASAHTHEVWVNVASAGNGGLAGASADGGAATIGDVNTGDNVGNSIGVGNTSYGGVYVRGGTSTNKASIGVSVDGGGAIADASGGYDNLAAID
jgi:hypothetical protein